MIRRYGAAPDRDRAYLPRHGAYGILWRDGALLLTMQSEPRPELQLPGGGVDPGESPLRALHREVFEETGWSIAAPRLLGVFRRFAFMPEYDIWAEKICHVYAARPVRRLGPPTEDGHAELWAPPPVAAEMLGNAGERDFVARHCAAL